LAQAFKQFFNFGHILVITFYNTALDFLWSSIVILHYYNMKVRVSETRTYHFCVLNGENL